MKKIHFTCYVMMMLLLAAGCRQMEEIEPAAVRGSHTLRAVLESEPGTKTHLGGPDANGVYYPYWSENEDIAVYVDGIESPDKYTLVDGSGTVSGVFTGTVYGIDKVALYPYSSKVSDGLQGKVLNLNLPSTQTYKEGTFADGSFPMVAVCSSDELGFKNLCSVLRISMTGEVAVRSIKFVAHDSWMPVSGKATVRTDFVDEPELVMTEDGPNSVTLDCGYLPLDPENATEFFIVIPPGTYRGGFSIEIKTFKGTVTRSTDADIVFKRSQLRSIPTFECIADGEIDPDDIPYNEIWYWASNNRVHNPRGSFDKEIISNTFSDGKGVITFNGPVTQVGYEAFAYDNTLSRVVLPNSVESIGVDAFYYSGITSFHTPDQLKSVGDYAFTYCNSLTRIYGNHASADEKALVLEDGTLAAYAQCSLGADLVIPDGVLRISSNVFYNCSQIETVTIPESLETIEMYAFSDCPSLKVLHGTNPHLVDSRSFVNSDGCLSLWAGYGVTDYVIPGSVGYFGSNIFRNNKTLHSLTFPKWSSGSCSSGYFNGCDNLEFFYREGTYDDHHCLTIWGGDFLMAVTNVLPAEYTVPDIPGLRRTNYGLFRDNNTLERLTMPDDLPSIGSSFCYNAKKLRSVRMPAKLTSLGNNAFQGVTTLDTLYLRSFTPPSYSESNNYAGFGHEGLVICVPKGFEDVYKQAPTWSKYADYIQGYVYDDLQNPDYYISTDYSRDGSVTRLQKASKGAGIDLVLMGDGFTDTQIADGTYAAVMGKMADAFFSEEPYTTLKPMFNVYSVDVVSATEGYEHPGQALGGWFGDGTRVGGTDSKCFDYALRAVSEDRMDNTLIIVAMNSTRYAGTCYQYYPSGGDYGAGAAIAYFPLDENDERLAQLVHHEAGGHGFSKLDDEYAYESNGTIPQEEIEKVKKQADSYGWRKNVDFTDDPTAVKWSRFIADPRYAYDGLGCFEGACTYWKGAWRPTENSIMRHNTGGFNAPSRESIWYRAHKLAYGESWQYDYEEFVKYDEKNRKTASSSSAPARSSSVEIPRPALHPPVVVGRRWNEAAPAPAGKAAGRYAGFAGDDASEPETFVSYR